jgi:hypothetical protein
MVANDATEAREMTTNELKLAKAFRDAGIEQDKAETISQTIFDAIRDNVATKSDVELVRRDLTIVEQKLRGEIQSLKIWGGGIAVAAVGATVSILFAALHYWPPHIS